LVAGKIGLAPLPAGSAGHKTHVHCLGIGLNAASKNQQEAGKFLSWLATEEAMKIYAQNGGTPPVSSILNELSKERPEFSLVSDYASKYGYVVTGGTAAFAVPVYEVLAEKFSGFWAGQGDATTALKEAAAGMADRIKQ
jgi:multiple sugar transport system substrate-binding protein